MKKSNEVRSKKCWRRKKQTCDGSTPDSELAGTLPDSIKPRSILGSQALPSHFQWKFIYWKLAGSVIICNIY